MGVLSASWSEYIPIFERFASIPGVNYLWPIPWSGKSSNLSVFDPYYYSVHEDLESLLNLSMTWNVIYKLFNNSETIDELYVINFVNYLWPIPWSGKSSNLSLFDPYYYSVHEDLESLLNLSMTWNVIYKLFNNSETIDELYVINFVNYLWPIPWSGKSSNLSLFDPYYYSVHEDLESLLNLSMTWNVIQKLFNNSETIDELYVINFGLETK